MLSVCKHMQAYCLLFVHNHFTQQYNPEDNSEHHTRRRENLKLHLLCCCGTNAFNMAGRNLSLTAKSCSGVYQIPGRDFFMVCGLWDILW
jgi:hypothetical protein